MKLLFAHLRNYKGKIPPVFFATFARFAFDVV